ncbi:MAG: hypothetical protein E7587_04395 [Ruminococcaceae bacterium]|nr:hypothetical protein [Oscillospiraceae bacterium]
MYTKETFLAALGECKLPDSFAQNFESVADGYYKNGVSFLREEFIKGVEDRREILGSLYPFVLESAEKVRSSETASLYSLCLYDMLKNSTQRFAISKSPKADSEDLEEKKLFEMAAYFALFAFAPELMDWCERAELPEDVAIGTLGGAFRGPFEAHLQRNGYYGFDSARLFAWQQLYLDHELIRVGILNFELRKSFLSNCLIFKNKTGETRTMIVGKDISAGGMISGSKGHEDKAFCADMTETDEYYEGYITDSVTGKVLPTPVRLYKNEWEIALRESDQTISVHIPAGVSFTEENLTKAYNYVLRIVEKSFPEFKPKAFICLSWLISTQLKDFLKPTSNILGFQSKFNCKIPIVSQGLGVISFLFLLPTTETDYNKFPENTSLQKKIKEYYLSGGTVYEWGGAFLI